MPLDLQIRAAMRPKSLNREARTVEAILSTGADVDRGGFIERLEISGRAIDLSELPVPVLDTHRRESTRDILGSLTAARVEGGLLIGTLTISKRHEALLDDIEEGTLRCISVGYTINAFRDEADRATGRLVRIATGWTLKEASFVPIPADAGATVRSDTVSTQTSQTAQAPAPVQTTEAAPALTRAQVNTEIRALRQTFGLPEAFANDLIDREATVEQARAAAVEAVRQRPTNSISTHTPAYAATGATPETFARAAGEALYCRANPSVTPSEAAREFMGLSVIELGRTILGRAGVLTTGMSPSAIVERMLTTSDFPAIMGDTVDRSLRAGYQAAPSALKAVARKSTARDFRRKTKLQISEAPTLEKVNEAGEFKHGALHDAKESYAIGTFGKIISVTRQLLVNDDVGAFTDMSAKWGEAAADFEAQQLVDLLEAGSGAGPVMDDGKTLFHTDHGNIAAAAAKINVTSLGEARLMMRKQKSIAGRPINVRPRYLVVPPELEVDAEQVLALIQPTTIEDVNPFGGKLELLVETRLSSATRWYLVSDPAITEGLEYSYLQGEEGPQIETKQGFEVDGMAFKVRLDFGAAFLEHRGWFRNIGQ
ncbi:Mu-like prophage major head subunit gpT [Rhodobacter aestuarii]|uniref:Mu-like prophage major head subunit gpT n=1 Tax=Rhodobacter aestuarii TaxID=453582 RepID=A0A1N7QF88_9RHOB|nr:prohead protease/major capsid protein fusion protein [Rhodobacter aestuarii]PTV93497.1 Mu-like prophage major head subunit gpT [Rhodobacter aestuarii]SIT21532.1 Mu-like prophage major head subunit gpT [Rhodobacter aestuarii]